MANGVLSSAEDKSIIPCAGTARSCRHEIGYVHPSARRMVRTLTSSLGGRPNAHGTKVLCGVLNMGPLAMKKGDIQGYHEDLYPR
jgi:hypothetical protein